MSVVPIRPAGSRNQFGTRMRSKVVVAIADMKQGPRARIPETVHNRRFRALHVKALLRIQNDCQIRMGNLSLLNVVEDFNGDYFLKSFSPDQGTN